MRGRTLFADSGHWIALLHSRDQMHERATGEIPLNAPNLTPAA